MAAEGSGKAAGVLIADTVRNLRYRQIALLQQPRGCVHPHSAKITGHRHPIERLEAKLQGALGEMKLSRQFCKGDAAVLMGNQIVVRLAGALQHEPVK